MNDTHRKQSQPSGKSTVRAEGQSSAKSSEKSSPKNGNSARKFGGRKEASTASGRDRRSRGNNKGANNKSANNKGANNKGANNKGANNKGANNKGARRRNSKDSSIFDLFGAKRSRFSPRNKNYHPEFNKINLPDPDLNLVCAICDQKISELPDILEALEIYRGEFKPDSPSDNQGHPDDAVPAHFECVVQALSTSSALQTGESVAYLGSGRFAVVEGPQKKVKRMIERNWSQNPLLSPTNWSQWRQDLNSHTLLTALSIETDV